MTNYDEIKELTKSYQQESYNNQSNANKTFEELCRQLLVINSGIIVLISAILKTNIPNSIKLFIISCNFLAIAFGITQSFVEHRFYLRRAKFSYRILSQILEMYEQNKELEYIYTRIQEMENQTKHQSMNLPLYIQIGFSILGLLAFLYVSINIQAVAGGS
jgi:hypothetical protein